MNYLEVIKGPINEQKHEKERRDTFFSLLKKGTAKVSHGQVIIPHAPPLPPPSFTDGIKRFAGTTKNQIIAYCYLAQHPIGG